MNFASMVQKLAERLGFNPEPPMDHPSRRIFLAACTAFSAILWLSCLGALGIALTRCGS